MTLWKNLVVALVAAFALAACSSSDNDSSPPAEMEMPPEATGPTQEELDTANKRADDAETALAEERKKADAAKLKSLETILNAATIDPSDNPNNLRTSTDGQTMPEKDFTALDDPASVTGRTGSSWSTMDSATKMTTTAVQYSNKEDDTPTPFSTVYKAELENGAIQGADIMAKRISGVSGIPAHPSHDDLVMDGNDVLDGAYHGVAGKFSNAGGSAINFGRNAAGELEITGDTSSLVFTPSNVANKVMVEDKAYVNLGWWQTEDRHGEITGVKVAAFAGGDDKTYDGSSDFQQLSGTATFEGIAAGKYVHRSTAGLDGGHFTADAKLTANFNFELDGITAGNSVSGMIDTFMQDGTSLGKWSVSLKANIDTVNANGVAAIRDDDSSATFGQLEESTVGFDLTFSGIDREDDMPSGASGHFLVGGAGATGEQAVIDMIGAFATHNMEPDQQ